MDKVRGRRVARRIYGFVKRKPFLIGNNQAKNKGTKGICTAYTKTNTSKRFRSKMSSGNREELLRGNTIPVC